MLAADNAESTQPKPCPFPLNSAPTLPQVAHDAVSIHSAPLSARSSASPPPPLSLPGTEVIVGNCPHPFAFSHPHGSQLSSSRTPIVFVVHQQPSASSSTFYSLPVVREQAKFLTKHDLRLPSHRPIAPPLQNYALSTCKSSENVLLHYSTIASSLPN